MFICYSYSALAYIILKGKVNKDLSEGSENVHNNDKVLSNIYIAFWIMKKHAKHKSHPFRLERIVIQIHQIPELDR